MFFASLFAMAMVGLGGFLLMIILIGASISLSEPAPVVAKDSILVFDMSANIQDRPVAVTQEQVINEVLGRGGPPDYSLRAVLGAIEAASDDMRIKALYLKGSLRPRNYGSGFAALKEVRKSIEEFKEVSGKPVIAHLVYPSDKDIYLASVADRIIMNPEGLIMNAGLASEPMFYAGFFKKYGIGVQVTKAGEYKSAAESFVLEKMSAPARAQTQALLDDLWSDYVETVSNRTGMSADEFQALVDTKGLLNGKDALDAGLVDELGFGERVIEALKEASEDESEDLEFKATSLADYLVATQSDSSGDHVAVVYAEGAIVVGEGGEGDVGGSKLARQIRDLRHNDRVKAIVLRVNSPGGSALASEQIQHELRLAKQKMPVIVSMGTVAASGGYWISAYADKIYAEPNTITGSIGVIGMFMNFKEIANRHGFTFDVVKTGKFADALSIARPKSTEEMAIIQREVDDVYSDFLRKVAEGRGQDQEDIRKIAGGRVWSGVDALNIGLVDELGGLREAIAYAAQKAELGEDPSIRDYPKAKDFFEELMENLSTTASVADSNPYLQALENSVEDIRSISQFDDPRGIYTVLPFKIETN